jgi:hypothetical protein
MKNRSEHEGQIVGARIPDEDMPGWMETLRQGNFSEEEIDAILGHLNATYFDAKGASMVEKELASTIKYIEGKTKKPLDPEQKEYLKKGIEQRLGPTK